MPAEPPPARAVEEWPTGAGPADYVLCDQGEVRGVVEAKKLTVGAQGILPQAQRYSEGIRGAHSYRRQSRAAADGNRSDDRGRRSVRCDRRPRLLRGGTGPHQGEAEHAGIAKPAPRFSHPAAASRRGEFPQLSAGGQRCERERRFESTADQQHRHGPVTDYCRCADAAAHEDCGTGRLSSGSGGGHHHHPAGRDV